MNGESVNILLVLVTATIFVIGVFLGAGSDGKEWIRDIIKRFRKWL